MMRAHLLAALVTLGLAGCASHSQYGNFNKAPATQDRAMATDTVAHLVTIYPPAKTRLDFQQPTPDTYGRNLVALLRARGYSVSEFSSAPQQPTSTSSSAARSAGLPVRYVVDSLAPAAEVYRVTLLLGDQSITRAYAPQSNGDVIAAGAWSRKE